MKLSLPLKHIYVTQPFGVSYVDFYSGFGMKGHGGIDFRAKIGARCYATHKGIVTKSKDSQDFGQYIEILGEGFKTRYGHLSERYVNDGDEVIEGQLIGLTGNTGKYTTGPHLHFDLKFVIGGKVLDYNNGYYGAVDPTKYFPRNWDKSRAYHRYGRKQEWLAEFLTRFKNPWLHRQLKKANQMRLIKDTEFINALVYGGWGYDDLMNPNMWQNWAYLKKVEYEAGKRPFK